MLFIEGAQAPSKQTLATSRIENQGRGFGNQTSSGLMRLAMIRIPKEMQSLQSEPPETFRAKQLEDDILNWPFVFLGLNGSIYEGGMYHCNLILDKD